MRALLPEPFDAVDVLEAYAPPPGPMAGRFVRANMISSLDGAISVGGRSGLLGGPPDRRVFEVLRSWADVVVVGAGTARAEGYGPARLDEDLRAARVARGQSPVPPIAVVTASGRLDLATPFFTQAEARPMVVTGAAGAEALAGVPVADVADLVVAGGRRVDLAPAFDHLTARGPSLLLEGGPGLNADVVRAGLLDELCLTLSPRLVAGSGPRLFAGPELDPPLGAEVTSLLEEDGFFFFRLSMATERRSSDPGVGPGPPTRGWRERPASGVGGP